MKSAVTNLVLGVVVFLVTFAAVALLSGCGERPRCETYHFQSTFPQVHRADAKTAAAKWAAFSGFPVSIADGPDDENPVCGLGAIQTQAEYETRLPEVQGTNYSAIHRDSDGNIALAPMQWTWDQCTGEARHACVTWLLMHEFTHEYGLQHVHGASSDHDVLGLTSAEPRTEYGPGDEAELRRVKGQ